MIKSDREKNTKMKIFSYFNENISNQNIKPTLFLIALFSATIFLINKLTYFKIKPSEILEFSIKTLK